MKVKSLSFLLVLCFALTSCMKVKQIGKINMISNRNVDSKTDYVLLKNYMGGSKKQLRKLKALTLEDAIDKVVRNTPGGEFLKNVKVYSLNGKYYAVEGDIWGIASNANFQGFKVGDSVQWKEGVTTYKGEITDLKDDKQCTVKLESSGDLKVVKYSELLKITK
jgi:hypothetical protein